MTHTGDAPHIMNAVDAIQQESDVLGTRVPPEAGRSASGAPAPISNAYECYGCGRVMVRCGNCGYYADEHPVRWPDGEMCVEPVDVTADTEDMISERDGWVCLAKPEPMTWDYPGDDGHFEPLCHVCAPD